MLKSIAKKYNLTYSNDFERAQLCFAAVFDILLKKTRGKKSSVFTQLRKKDSITIVDVGSGYFRYGKVLHAILSRINQNINLFAVDKKRMISNYSPASFVRCDINEISSNVDLDKIDIFTVFNPFPCIPDLTNIPLNLKKKSILFGSVDWNISLFKESLEKNNFKAISWVKNPYLDKMGSWFNNYDPFVFACYD